MKKKRISKKLVNNDHIKTIVVKSYDWVCKINIDSDLFEDAYMEAATRVVEMNKNNPDFKVSVIIECFNENDAPYPDKHIIYNSYFVLINGGFHNKAEILRKLVKEEMKVDLKKEPLHGK
jgi:hypothetical protein